MTRPFARKGLPFPLCSLRVEPDRDDNVSTRESICESRDAYEGAVRRLKRDVTVVHAVEQRAKNRSSRAAVFMLSLFVAVPVALGLLAAYAAARDSHPTDEELTARFLAHESDFQTLAQMLDSDRRRLLLRAEPIDLADLVAAGASTANIGNYESLLARIGAKNFNYFPRSGNLVLPVSASGENFAQSRKSYSYLSREEPQPLLHHQSYALRGPGIYFVTGDHRIKGQWFIHHEGTVVVTFAPY
jgi:hypothetical protein